MRGGYIILPPPLDDAERILEEVADCDNDLAVLTEKNDGVIKASKTALYFSGS